MAILGAIVLVVALISVAGFFIISHKGSPTAVTFTDPDGRYSVQMPAQPTLNTAQSGPGYKIWTHKAGQSEAYSVGAVPLPSSADVSDSRTILEDAFEGGRSAVSGTVLDKSLGTYHGSPSLDGHLSVSGGYIAFREVLSGHTLYVVEVDGKENPPSGFQAVADSLMILKP